MTTDTDPFANPPTHQVVQVPVSKQMKPGRDYIIHSGHEWQVADCWWARELKEIFWGGIAFSGADAHWVVEAVRRT